MNYSIEIADSCVTIEGLVIFRKEVAEFLRSVPEEEREALAREAFEVGVFCLERARNTQDLEFVRRQIDSLLAAVEKAVTSIPATTEANLLGKLGTADGQLLAPIQGLIQQVEKGTQQQLREVRELLANEIDPSRASSTVAKALKQLADLLDVGRVDSVQGRVEASLRTIIAEDGVLAKSVKLVVAESIRPLADEVNRLSHLVTGQDAAAAVLAQTVAKGMTFEEQVVARVQQWGGSAGVEVTHCGVDNQPGDVLVKLSSRSLAAAEFSIVIECKDQANPAGRKPIGDSMARAMSERGASRGLYLGRSSGAFAKEIGEWAEGSTQHGSWVATTLDHLVAGLRFSIAMHSIEQARASGRSIDAGALLAQASRIRDTLRKVTNINTKAGDIRTSADAIIQEATRMRSEISDALQLIEDMLVASGVEHADAA